LADVEKPATIESIESVVERRHRQAVCRLEAIREKFASEALAEQARRKADPAFGSAQRSAALARLGQEVIEDGNFAACARFIGPASARSQISCLRPEEGYA